MFVRVLPSQRVLVASPDLWSGSEYSGSKAHRWPHMSYLLIDNETAILAVKLLRVSAFVLPCRIA